MDVDHLAQHPDCIEMIARWHFDQWGALTGAATLEEYVPILATHAKSSTIPAVLVAREGTKPLGSVSLIECDMTIRPDLSPWLAQLFVVPVQRRRGIGAALVEATLAHARDCGLRRVYLYTSGTLPDYYERLGWTLHERVEYLGKLRTVMQHDVEGGPSTE